MSDKNLGSRFKSAWNAFFNKDPTMDYRYTGPSYYYRPDRVRLTRGNERSIVTAVYNRISMDVAAVDIRHVKLDYNNRFLDYVDSGLNRCLSIEANTDQTGRAFIQDVMMSMMDEGCVAIVPTDTDDDPESGMPGSFDIDKMRTGKITQWYPQHVKVLVYNENAGKKEEIIFRKDAVAIIENPFYSVMNEPNSTMQRLIRKLALLDIVDEQSSAGKLDLIIQLPYIIKTEARRVQAENRRKDIEQQLAGSKYGIAYTDGTERITQLNRPVENNLMKQIEYLTSMLYSQLGITKEILDGTADEKVMLNYYTRTIEPFLSAITEEMKRKFLTKTARSQHHSIAFFRDPLKLVPTSDLAEIADKFTRNEIMTSNEIRQIIGMKPANDPRADELRNSNLNQPDTGYVQEENPEAYMAELDDYDRQLDDLERSLAHSEFLMHYASKYYDPVKAHEYYERTKELRGRKSTTGLNDEGKEAAAYVREQLKSEKKQKVEAHGNSTKAQIESKREQKQNTVQEHRERMNSEIQSLRERLSSMSKEERAANRDSIREQIQRLREDNKAERERISEEFNVHAKQLREGHSTYRKEAQKEYDDKYVAELDKMKADDKFKANGRGKKNKVLLGNHPLNKK